MIIDLRDNQKACPDSLWATESVTPDAFRGNAEVNRPRSNFLGTGKASRVASAVRITNRENFRAKMLNVKFEAFGPLRR